MKEQFKEMIRSKNYPLEWFYHYYNVSGGTPINIHIFMQMFSQFDFNTLLDNVAKSFGFTRLTNKEGILIAVYE